MIGSITSLIFTNFWLKNLLALSLIVWLDKLLRPWVTRPKGGPYAPGPKPRLIIGNMLDLPATNVAETYRQWSKKYNSDILFASALGSNVLILNKREDADELFERRSRIYSDRAPLPILDLMDWDYNSALAGYGDVWRRSRKVFQQHFRQEVIPNYYPIIHLKSQQMLKRLFVKPENFVHHSQMYSISIPMTTMYGYDARTTEDPAVIAAETSLHLGCSVLLPGATIANVFPILQHVPSFFPGMGFKKITNAARHYTREMKRIPMDFVNQQIKQGIPNTSIIGNFVKMKHSGAVVSEEEELAHTNMAATIYGTATETTTSLLISFFYYMVTNPQVQKKAQAELELVVGNRRLPTFEDRSDLPYIEAIYREVHRLQPPVPVAIPHTATEDDYYKGYFIPKGTAVIGNIWAMARDETKYENPDEFYPERFFDENGHLNKDDRVLAFGFGRRVCAGKHMGNATMWLAVASVLAIYNINRAKDDQGREVEINHDYDDFGLTRQKQDFKCSIVPRSDEARRLVEAINAEI